MWGSGLTGIHIYIKVLIVDDDDNIVGKIVLVKKNDAVGVIHWIQDQILTCVLGK